MIEVFEQNHRGTRTLDAIDLDPAAERRSGGSYATTGVRMVLGRAGAFTIAPADYQYAPAGRTQVEPRAAYARSATLRPDGKIDWDGGAPSWMRGRLQRAVDALRLHVAMETRQNPTRRRAKRVATKAAGSELDLLPWL